MACQQARAGGTAYVFTGPNLTSRRRRPLCSNVWPQKIHFSPTTDELEAT
jgi:hypothetical protein